MGKPFALSGAAPGFLKGEPDTEEKDVYGCNNSLITKIQEICYGNV